MNEPNITRKASLKCNCGQGRKLYCNRCSKVRMVIPLKNNHDHLKIKRPNGEEANPVWYSFLKYNKKDVYSIAEKMEQKIRLHPEYKSAANVLLFYINGQRHEAFKKVVL